MRRRRRKSIADVANHFGEGYAVNIGVMLAKFISREPCIGAQGLHLNYILWRLYKD
jgi:hypothetical protein